MDESTSRYWLNALRRPVSRRGVLRGASIAGAGLAGAALIGCGGSVSTPATATKGFPSPVNALGLGFGMSVKPDLLAQGGRVSYDYALLPGPGARRYCIRYQAVAVPVSPLRAVVGSAI